MSKYINRFTMIPKELFRLSNGSTLSLCGRTMKTTGSYDILTEGGKVKPKAITYPETYEGPNGASMRPNTPTQHQIVRNFKVSGVIIYAVPKDTRLPDGLVLVHERGDHSFSPVAWPRLMLAELNTKINNFLAAKAQRMTKSEWLEKYPAATETP
ncbi:uncharacterized protein Z518_03813 [Rhinocladiella mackenziei CBS 650.93]|uniref:Rhinocladiella mackenziei CBS 650.93 unplaced genomic scaffold supercont1.3, whole genome shotgun sequence n=1 Tax=Rhinocladiella mackenziei CBS 650.93 TaxID=1442369 RepID=A0A0D2J9P5_9EURO|nr:uncharacterized protein Z518_03813 [Rhinocladiella mackenziei CBS 650.93]KIX05840.1 hypothetical protein Z518_03813 [Rhinocladiella mackenziei CBS 650.93]